MRSCRSLLLMLLPIVGGVVLTGCEAPPPPPAPAPVYVPASPAMTYDVQAQFQKMNPSARVGHVSAVNSSGMTVAVSGIPLAAVHMGDSLAFVDSSLKSVANGTIIDQDATTPGFQFLIVKFQAASRAPRRGDLAVFLPLKP